MRVLLTIAMKTDTANRLAGDGKLGETIQAIVEDQQPEAVYFTEHYGERTAYMICDVPDASHIPRFCEPWFLAFDAKIEFRPVMTPDDLARAGEHIDNAARKYAHLNRSTRIKK